jgi:hypothetical protein
MTSVPEALARVRAVAARPPLLVEGQTFRRPPVVVFDLDGTLFDNGPRTWQILLDFAEQERLPALRRALDKAPRTGLPYLLKDTLAKVGVDNPAIVDRAVQFWRKRFFTDDDQRHDIPLPGAVAYVAACYEAGATIVYLSGRDAPNMLVGVCASLRAHGFPVGIARTSVVLKHDFHDDDLEFKRSALDFIDTHGEVVASFDNEPANCNAFVDRWPEGVHVFVDTQHAPDPPPLHESIVVVEDLTW